MTATEQPDEYELIHVPFKGPLPSQMADLWSLKADFEFARDCATAYLNLDVVSMDKPSRDVVARALWSAAVISYRRGFTGGKAHLVPQAARLKIPASFLNALTPEYKTAHEEILALAN